MNLLLDGRSHAQKIEDAIDFLKENGYVVVGPFEDKCEVKNPAQLVRYFYDRLSQHKPRLTTKPHNIKKERCLAKSFIQSRMDAGRSKNQALRECCDLIDILFKYEDYLGLHFSVTSMGVFGQGEMGWVTDKILKIKEGLDREVNIEENTKFFNNLYREQEKTIDEEGLEKAKSRMDEVLKRYAEENSKKDR